MTRKYPNHHTFRCDDETQDKLEYLLISTQYNKSFLIRECILQYFDNLKESDWLKGGLHHSKETNKERTRGNGKTKAKGKNEAKKNRF